MKYPSYRSIHYSTQGITDNRLVHRFYFTLRTNFIYHRHVTYGIDSRETEHFLFNWQFLHNVCMIRITICLIFYSYHYTKMVNLGSIHIEQNERECKIDFA